MIKQAIKENGVFHASIMFKAELGTVLLVLNLVLCCPDCFSTDISRNGTRQREHSRVESFMCNDHACLTKRGKKTGRQFTVLTSGEIRKLVDREIATMIDALYRRGAKAKTIAAQHGVSDAFVSLLRASVDATIARGVKRDKLVSCKTKDQAVSIDETFFKIDGETIYVIIVRGYKSSKVLGINVSTSRAEADMRKTLDDAQANTSKRIAVITTDAHEATRAMARHLGYPVTLIVHPHKKPYDKAIIERIEYDGNVQIHTLIGVSTDIFKKQKKRQFTFKQITRPVNTPEPKPRGRPKGSKKKAKGALKDTKNPKKRGRPSIFDVFKSGRKGYVKVKPRKRQLVFSNGTIPPVVKGMQDAFELFAGKCIQNNHSETMNNTIRTVVHLGGLRSIKTLDGRIRSVIRLRNDPALKLHLKDKRRHGASVYFKRMAGADFKADYSNCSIEVQAKA
jgi:hypothetical protein